MALLARQIVQDRRAVRGVQVAISFGELGLDLLTGHRGGQHAEIFIEGQLASVKVSSVVQSFSDRRGHVALVVAEHFVEARALVPTVQH